MLVEGIVWDILLTLACYAYVLLVILASSRMDRFLHIPRRASRKFLHIMIGNLPFIVTFFTSNMFPALVAAPFVLVTYLASPYSPFKGLSVRMKGLADITEEGHQLGLVFYAVSYTLLALFFASKPYVIAAGILPMAYGDAAASLVGEKWGKRRYGLIAEKSMEGSAAMFLVSSVSLVASLFYFSMFYDFSVLDKLVAALAAVAVAAVAEGLSPRGFDNLTVPAFGVLTFLFLGGGV